MASSFLAELAASGAALFQHENRLLKLRFAEASGIADGTLLPQSLAGEEMLSAGYRYVLECLCADAYFELKAVFAQPVEIALLLPDGGERLLTGIVTRAEALGADGGFARFRLTIEPALSILGERRNSRVFQDRTVVEIVQAILDEHLAANPVLAASFAHESRVTRSYPTRSYCLQYRESDRAFIERLLAEEGISYRYTHGPDPATSIRTGDAENDAEDDTPLHTLILFDADTAAPESAPGTLRFHRTDGVETMDAIDAWTGSRTLQSGTSSLTTWDYKAVSHYPGAQEQATRQGEAGAGLTATLEDYDPQTAYYGADPDEAGRYASLRQQAKDLASKTFAGQGTVRALEVGRWFELQDHPIHDQDAPEDREFLVTGLHFEAQNNLLPDDPPALAGLLQPQGSGQATPPYRNTFTAVRRHIPLVPAYHRTRHQKPTAPGRTTATVVGPEGEEIYTDEHGRIKIQFHWQRPQDHPEGGADRDERSSTWVRVAYPSAGAQWGTQYIPRIGQEVVIDFIEGDIDRPLVTGVVYNGSHRPPTFSGAGQLPANKTLSGTKSKEYKGSRYNELLFDDSTGEIRTKLSSEHGKTQLNQGYLIHPRTQGKGTPRGEGFELRTDHHGAIRAGQGLFLTTEPQPQASGKQIARDLAQSQLDAAYELTKSLGDVATKQLADTIEHGPEKVSPDNAKEEATKSGHLKHHVEALKAWEAGTNTDQESKTAKDEAGKQPILILSSPAGIAQITAQNATTAAGTNLDLIAQRDTNQTSGRRWLHNVGQHISLFVNGVKDKIALKLIAAQGKVQMQAQHGEMEFTSEKDQTVTSCKRKIRVAAGQEVLLTSGGGYIRIKGGRIEVHCPGTISIKGSNHQWSGPASMFPDFPSYPGQVLHDEQFELLHSNTGKPLANVPYRMTYDDKITEGVTDPEGRTPRVHTGPRQTPVKVEFMDAAPSFEEFVEGEDLGC